MALITTSSFNTIVNNVTLAVGSDNLVSGGGYGYALATRPVTQKTPSLHQHWYNLWDSINRAWVHQKGVNIPWAPAPVKGTTITGLYKDALTSASIAILSGLGTYDSGQMAWSTPSNGSNVQTQSTTWTTAVVRTVNYQWSEGSDQAAGFFNLNGRLGIDLSWTGSSGSADDLAWQALVDAFNSLDAPVEYDAADYWAGTTVTGSRTIGLDSITWSWSKVTNNSVVLTLTLDPAPGRSLTIDVVSEAKYYYATGGSGNVLGIPAARPLVLGGAYEAKTRILSIDPVPDYVFSAETSNTQTVTVRNLGNATATITATSFTVNGDLTALPDYTWGSFPVSIPGGTYKTFDLGYTGANTGTFYNLITLYSSDNDLAHVHAATTQTVTLLELDYTVSPSSLVTTATLISTVDTKFSINLIRNTYSSYTATISPATGFTITSFTSDGPVVRFSPLEIANSSTTATILTITAQPAKGLLTPVSKTVPIEITRDAEETRNIDTWVSALAKYNCVVGASYDVIAGQRYLTLGFGMGADGSPKRLDNGGSSYIDITNLGIDADPKPENGLILYPMVKTYLGTTTGETFLKTYGVWVRPETTMPVNWWQRRTYTINAKTSGYYNYDFAAVSDGYFAINDVLVADLRDRPLGTLVSGQIYLTAGEHSLTLFVLSDLMSTSSSSGIGIRIKNATTSEEIWSTLVPVRNTLPYEYWSEVYRFPINTGAVADTMYSKNYIVKNTGPVDGVSWGGYFGEGAAEGSMFTVKSDGYGNVEIILNRKSSNTGPAVDGTAEGTTGQASYAFYYYGNPTDRITQLETPTGDNTHYFVGFTREKINGSAVRTSLVPKYTATAVYNSGGSAADQIIETTIISTLADYAIFGEAASGSLAADLWLVGTGGQYGTLLNPASLGILGGGYLLLTGIQEGNVGKAAVGGAILYAVFSTGLFCFTGSTLVKMEDGSTKPISECLPGDRVMNHNGTDVNTVTFKIENTNYQGKLCGINGLDPFVSPQHPLIINGELSGVDADYVNANYPWLGNCTPIQDAVMVDSSGQVLYNLLVDGDGTYTANGLGASSVLGSGGHVVSLVNDGTITREMALHIFGKVNDVGGSYLLEFYNANSKPDLDVLYRMVF